MVATDCKGLLAGLWLGLSLFGLRSATAQVFVPPGAEHGVQLQFGLDPQAEPRLDAEGRLTGTPVLRALEDFRVRRNLRFERLVRIDDDALRALRARAEARTGQPAPDLRTHFAVVSDRSAEVLADIGNEIATLDGVQWVWLAALRIPPPSQDLAPPTPSYQNRQGYFEVPGGLDLAAARQRGLTGAGVRVSDVEYGWINDHEDLGTVYEEPNQTIPSFVFSNNWNDHGAAVLGIMGALANRYGMEGAGWNAGLATYPEYSVEELSRRPAAITRAVMDSQVGDVVVLEMQTVGRPGGGFVPAEVNPSVWQAVKLGTDAGVVITAAAGNGNEDLDASAYADYRSRGDSGAIIVGAGTDDASHRKLGFSSYGSRVDVQGWGTGVATLAYGDLARLDGDERQTYTARFGGTSSATPIVTSAVILLQERARERLGRSLDSVEMRAVLKNTGIPQGGNTGRPIGPFPDLDAALLWVESREISAEPLDLAPVNEGDVARLEARAAVSEGGPLAFEWNVGGQTLTGQMVEFSPADDGRVLVNLRIQSEFGAVASVDGSLEVLNVAPTLTATVPDSVVEGDPVEQPLLVGDPGADSVELSFLDEPAPENGARVVGSTLAFTPTYGDAMAGSLAFRIGADDDDGGLAELEIIYSVEYRDRDEDGVPDTWETSFGFDPADPTDAEADPDGDGRNQRVEFEQGSDPRRDDRPLGPTLLEPADGAVVPSLALAARVRTSTASHRFRLWTLDGEVWAESASAPATGDRLSWNGPDRLPDENQRLRWSAVAFDPWAESDAPPPRELLYSAIDEAPAPPSEVEARRVIRDERVRVTVEGRPGVDPELRPVTLEARLRLGTRVVDAATALPGPDGLAAVELEGPKTPGLTWSVRSVDEGSHASDWSEPTAIAGLEDCSCTATRPMGGPVWASAWALGGLAILLLVRARNRASESIQ
jgi:hypothetical protein